VAPGISVKIGLWTFHKLLKKQKKLTLLTYGCPSYERGIGTTGRVCLTRR